MTALGLAVLRLAVAAVLVLHGAHQLFGIMHGPGAGPGGLAATAAYFSSLKLAPAMPLALAAGVVQLVGGALIGVGLLTRWAAVAAGAYLGLLIWKDYLRWGFFMNWSVDPTRGQGVEYAGVLIAALVCIVLAGAGGFSIDGLRARSAASRASGRARARGVRP